MDPAFCPPVKETRGELRLRHSNRGTEASNSKFTHLTPDRWHHIIGRVGCVGNEAVCANKVKSAMHDAQFDREAFATRRGGKVELTTWQLQTLGFSDGRGLPSDAD